MKPIKIEISKGSFAISKNTDIGSGIASFIKILGWITIIAGIIIGFMNGKNGIDSHSSAQFNTLIAFTDWISYSTKGALLIGFGDIILYLKILAFNEQEYKIDRSITGSITIEDDLPVKIIQDNEDHL